MAICSSAKIQDDIILVCLVMFLVDLHKENTNIELMSVSGKV
jgi:hypothetical protein